MSRDSRQARDLGLAETVFLRPLTNTVFRDVSLKLSPLFLIIRLFQAEFEMGYCLFRAICVICHHGLSPHLPPPFHCPN